MNILLELIYGAALFITAGGHIIDTKFKVHHYSNEDFKEILFLQPKKEISKKCIKHSKVETIVYKNIHRENGSQRNFTISEPYPIQDTPQQDTFNSQRPHR